MKIENKKKLWDTLDNVATICLLLVIRGMASTHYSPSIPWLPTRSPKVGTFSLTLSNPKRYSSSFPTVRASSEEAVMSIDNLHSFIQLNMGRWNGSFYVSVTMHKLLRLLHSYILFFFLQQFDASGHLLQQISTKLSATSYGEDHLMSLIQT